jgi:small subunit ribosomal protein S20
VACCGLPCAAARTRGRWPLAHHKSAIKRIRQTQKRRRRNRHVRSETRTVVKSCRSALASGDPEAASEKFRLAERALRRAASKGVIPKARAERSVSRLAKKLNALGS